MLLAVDIEDSVETIKEYFEKEKFTFQPVRQKKDEISKAYGVSGYPTNYVIGPDGKVASRMVGFDAATLRAVLDKLAPKK